MKQPFNIIQSTCVPLPLENVDTDQIIPARFLKSTDRNGFGENLFRDWRFNPDGSPKDFVLNDPAYHGEILVAGRNFGCGSSASTPPGPSPATASAWWSAASSPTYTNRTS